VPPPAAEQVQRQEPMLVRAGAAAGAGAGAAAGAGAGGGRRGSDVLHFNFVGCSINGDLVFFGHGFVFSSLFILQKILIRNFLKFIHLSNMKGVNRER
jgi:hypothetical protein